MWTLFSLKWQSDYLSAPSGDGAYYTGMTYSFYSNHRDQVVVSSLHAPRILGAFLAASLLKLQGMDNSEAKNFPYDRTTNPPETWDAKQTLAYFQIHHMDQVLNFLFFPILALFIALLTPSYLTFPLGLLVTLNMLLTPSLSLITIFWPQMYDVITICLFSASLFFLTKKWDTLAFVTLGIAALAREQVLMLLPAIYLFRRFNILQAVILGFTPYALVMAFPLFKNAIPLFDSNSNSVAHTTFVPEVYLNIVKYHWQGLFSQKGMAHPLAMLLNLGTVWIALYYLKAWKQTAFLALLCLSMVFMADRHMILLTLVGLYGLNFVKIPENFQVKRLTQFLSVLLGFKVLLLMTAQSASWLQVELWYMLVDPTTYRIAFQVFWYMVLLLFLSYRLYTYWRGRPKTEGKTLPQQVKA